jgi:hypothetical protein
MAGFDSTLCGGFYVAANTKEKRGVKLIDGRYGKSYQNSINEINIAKELYPEVKARLDGEIKRLDKWQSEKKDFKSPVICFRFSDNVFYVYSACIKNLLRFDVQQILISTSSLLYLKRW